MTTLSTHPANRETAEFYVVHPLDDVPEQKRSAEGLGLMKMTSSVRISLLALRGYLILVMLLALYRVLTLAGVFPQSHPH